MLTHGHGHMHSLRPTELLAAALLSLCCSALVPAAAVAAACILLDLCSCSDRGPDISESCSGCNIQSTDSNGDGITASRVNTTSRNVKHLFKVPPYELRIKAILGG